MYAFQYRLYCNFTHASLRSIFEWPAVLPKLDHITVGSCAVTAIEAVRDLGGPTHHLASLRDSLNKLTAMTGIDMAKGTVKSRSEPAKR